MTGNDIFIGAKFGDKFVTREGKILYYQNSWYIYVYLFDEDLKTTRYFYNGSAFQQPTIICKYPEDSTTHSNTDIVSRYKESVDEKRLDELAIKYANEKWSNEWPYLPYESGNEEPDVIKDFKEGYRKAMEE